MVKGAKTLHLFTVPPRDEDHLALCLELLGRMPRRVAGAGRYAKDFFNRAGELRHIKRLRFWPLPDVLADKYEMPPAQVQFLPGPGCTSHWPMWQS